MTRVFAYCRVSTADQTTDNQVQEITAMGFVVNGPRIITETVSGSVAAMERKGFLALLNKLESGDVLVVTKLDRLGRNAMDVRSTVEHLNGLGVRVHCLSLGGSDLTSPAGKMIMTVIAAMAEFERDLLVERTQSGLARAKSQGKTLGRPQSLGEAASKAVVARLAQGEAVAALAREFGTSRQSIMRIRQAHGQIPNTYL
jgi:putative DNA-invertase from lambdoid prophage Rac